MFICCKAKDAISKVNRQTINSEKNICDAEDKGLPSIIYKGLSQSEEKRANNPKEIMAKDMNRQFTKE